MLKIISFNPHSDIDGNTDVSTLITSLLFYIAPTNPIVKTHDLIPIVRDNYSEMFNINSHFLSLCSTGD